MSYELRRYAAEHFADIENRKQREGAAERRLIRLFFDDKADGLFIEVGANDPKNLSQTWHLEELGWSGILVEPIPALCAALREQRPKSAVVQAACAKPADRGTAEFLVAKHDAQSALSFDKLEFRPDIEETIKVRVMTLDDVISEDPDTQGKPFDFVSIDVEGAQIDVLRGYSLKQHRPKLLLIEDHMTDLQTHRVIRRRGYRLAKRTGLNNWYVPDGQPFALTTPGERFKLWRKVYLRTWVRGLTFRVRRLFKKPG